MEDAALQLMLDRSSVADLVYELAACLDEGRSDDLALLLTDGVSAGTPAGRIAGREQVLAQLVQNHQSAAGIQHLISNVQVTVDGDQAEVRANIVLIRASSSSPDVDFSAGGVYRFGAERAPQGWRLCRIDAQPVWLAKSRAEAEALR